MTQSSFLKGPSFSHTILDFGGGDSRKEVLFVLSGLHEYSFGGKNFIINQNAQSMINTYENNDRSFVRNNLQRAIDEGIININDNISDVIMLASNIAPRRFKILMTNIDSKNNKLFDKLNIFKIKEELYENDPEYCPQTQLDQKLETNFSFGVNNPEHLNTMYSALHNAKNDTLKEVLGFLTEELDVPAEELVEYNAAFGWVDSVATLRKIKEILDPYGINLNNFLKKTGTAISCITNLENLKLILKIEKIGEADEVKKIIDNIISLKGVIQNSKTNNLKIAIDRLKITSVDELLLIAPGLKLDEKDFLEKINKTN